MILIFSEKKETKSFASTLGSSCLGNVVTLVLFINESVILNKAFWVVDVFLNLSLIVRRFGCPANPHFGKRPCIYPDVLSVWMSTIAALLDVGDVWLP